MAIRLAFPFLAAALLSAPAAAQERQWLLDASGEDAYLVFGVPDSDDVGISLWCPIQQGTVNIFLPEAPADLPAGQAVSITLSTDDASADVEARTEPNAEAGVSSVEAAIPVDHPILVSMLKADRLRVKVGSEETVFPLFDADLSGLIELCRTR